MMPKRNELRGFNEEERQYWERRQRSRTAAKQQVERARIWVGYAARKPSKVIAEALRIRAETVWNVVKRFNARGLASLEDDRRSGRPAVYDEAVRGQLVMTAKTHPQQLGRAYSHWTLERLREYIHAHLHIPISRSQLGVILEQEGRKWYQEKTCFSESPDPQFVEKRGDSASLQAPPEQTRILCLDEMGPVSAKTYPAPRWSVQRSPLTPDCGRRASTWVFGAFEPHTGQALTHCAPRTRDCPFSGAA